MINVLFQKIVFYATTALVYVLGKADKLWVKVVVTYHNIVHPNDQERLVRALLDGVDITIARTQLDMFIDLFAFFSFFNIVKEEDVSYILITEYLTGSLTDFDRVTAIRQLIQTEPSWRHVILAFAEKYSGLDERKRRLLIADDYAQFLHWVSVGKKFEL